MYVLHRGDNTSCISPRPVPPHTLPSLARPFRFFLPIRVVEPDPSRDRLEVRAGAGFLPSLFPLALAFLIRPFRFFLSIRVLNPDQIWDQIEFRVGAATITSPRLSFPLASVLLIWCFIPQFVERIWIFIMGIHILIMVRSGFRYLAALCFSHISYLSY